MITKHKQTILAATLTALLANPLSLLAQNRYSIPADPNLNLFHIHRSRRGRAR